MLNLWTAFHIHYIFLYSVYAFLMQICFSKYFQILDKHTHPLHEQTLCDNRVKPHCLILYHTDSINELKLLNMFLKQSVLLSSESQSPTQSQVSVIVWSRRTKDFDFGLYYCQSGHHHRHHHPKLFRHFQRSYHQVLYLFGNLSWPPTQIPTQMQKFCKFFCNPFLQPNNLNTSRCLTPKCYTFLETSHEPCLGSNLRCKNLQIFCNQFLQTHNMNITRGPTP